MKQCGVSQFWWCHYSCGDSSQRRSGQAIGGALSAFAATDGLDTAHDRRHSGAVRLKNTLLKSWPER